MTQISTIYFLSNLVFLSMFHSSMCTPNSTLEVDRDFTGITFTAFVRDVSIDLTPHPSWNNYTLSDIKTMMKVISGKFSKIFAYGVRAKSGEYQENATYYSSYPQVLSAQAAALVNQEEAHPRLSLLVGALISTNPVDTNISVKVAFESVTIAHAIYPGTVHGIVFHSKFSWDDPDISSNADVAYLTLSKIKESRQDPSTLNLKIGTAQNCNGMEGHFNNSEKRLKMYRREIINASDFVICTDISDETDLLDFKNVLTEINDNIEVMGQVIEMRAETHEQIVEMKNIWERMDKWGRDNNMTIWMHEAFDNPWKYWNPHTGWWNLTSNELIGNVSGYVEKIGYKDKLVDIKVNIEGSNHAGMYVGVAFGLGFLALIVVVPLVIIHQRFNRLQDVLSKEDINIFLYGTADKRYLKGSIGDGGEHGEIEMDALSKPYDRSFEISKDDFKIEWHRTLGSGEFGIVLVAILSSEGEDFEVALKMAKPGCPKSVMKSLLSEIKILLLLGEHPHIVSMKGAYTAEIHKGVVYIATELCEMGSLKSYLNKGDKKIAKPTGYANVSSTCKANSKEAEVKVTIAFEELIRWSYEIACGMEYLASKHVIHADLAARNVLLTADKTAKITDFGLSRRLYDYTNYVKKQQEPLPWRWMAIESLKKLEFSSQSDVWSYGVTLWEIFSLGDIPYPGLEWTMDFVLVLENGLRLKRPSNATPEIFDVMSSCWIKEPPKRPSFSHLKARIAQLAMEYGKATR